MSRELFDFNSYRFIYNIPLLVIAASRTPPSTSASPHQYPSPFVADGLPQSVRAALSFLKTQPDAFY
jgi:hypothetical protein